MAWIRLAQRADDGLFCGVVHFAHVIVGRFFLDRDDVEVAGRAVDDASRFARRRDGDSEHWMHKFGDQ